MISDTTLRERIVAHLGMEQVGPDDWRQTHGSCPVCDDAASRDNPHFKVSDEGGALCFKADPASRTKSLRWVAEKLGLDTGEPAAEGRSKRVDAKPADKPKVDVPRIYAQASATDRDLALVGKYLATRGLTLTASHLRTLRAAGVRVNRYTPKSGPNAGNAVTEIVYPVREIDPDTGTLGDVVRQIGRIQVDPDTGAKLRKTLLGDIPDNADRAFVIDPAGPAVPLSDKRAVVLEGFEDAVTVWLHAEPDPPRIYLVTSSWSGIPKTAGLVRHALAACVLADPDPPDAPRNPLPSLRGALLLRAQTPTHILVPRLGHKVDANKAAQEGRFDAWDASLTEPTLDEITAAESWGAQEGARDGHRESTTGVLTNLDEAPPAYSDDALAIATVNRYGEQLRHVAQFGNWYFWEGHRWSVERTLRVYDLVRVVCREQARALAESLEEQGKPTGPARGIASAKTIAAVERIVRADRRIAALPEQWDADPWVLNTPGGVVDLRKGILRPHQREDYLAKCTTVTPAPLDGIEQACPRWIQFLDEVFQGDVELIRYVQRVLGYTLTGTTDEHCLIFLYGTGRNGKSTLIETVAEILADYQRTAPMEAFTESRNDRHPTDLAGLQGARLVTATETEEGRRWSESRLKSLTGGDTITARFMRGDFFDYTPAFKLWIVGNHRPRLRNIDVAMAARIKLVPFNARFEGRDRDPHLRDKLRAEAPGILAWMIEGCLDWQTDGLRDPQAVQEATGEYLESEDAVGRWLDECCVVDVPADRSAFQTPLKALFESWAAWSEANREYTGTTRRLAENLENRGFHRVRTSAWKGLRGIAIQAEESREPDAPVDHASRAAGDYPDGRGGWA